MDGREGEGGIRVDGERGRESRSQRGRGEPENEIFFSPESTNFKSFWWYAFTQLYS